MRWARQTLLKQLTRLFMRLYGVLFVIGFLTEVDITFKPTVPMPEYGQVIPHHVHGIHYITPAEQWVALSSWCAAIVAFFCCVVARMLQENDRGRR
jgi:hypothetical protein